MSGLLARFIKDKEAAHGSKNYLKNVMLYADALERTTRMREFRSLTKMMYDELCSVEDEVIAAQRTASSSLKPGITAIYGSVG